MKKEKEGNKEVLKIVSQGEIQRGSIGHKDMKADKWKGVKVELR